MLNETETALNVKNSVQLQIQHYILSDVSTRTPHPLPFPPGPLSDDSRRTQKYAPTGVVFQISIPQAHILYIEYRRVF